MECNNCIYISTLKFQQIIKCNIELLHSTLVIQFFFILLVNPMQERHEVTQTLIHFDVKLKIRKNKVVNCFNPY